MPDPNPGCAQRRCCFNIGDDIAGCFHVAGLLGFNYFEGMDGIDHLECWAGISEANDPDVRGCNQCGTGCFRFEDDIIALTGNSFWTGSKTYMRSSPQHRWGRDAKNQIFDLRSDEPVLVQRLCAMEMPSCYLASGAPLTHSNGWSCWGHHICQCITGPFCNNQDGFPATGMRGSSFLINSHRWPPRPGGVTSLSPLFCRKIIPFGPGDSQRNFFFSIHRNSYNGVVISDRYGLGADLLAPCAGFRAPTVCQHNAGAGAGDDCVYGGNRFVGTPISPAGEHMDEVWIDIPTTSMTLRAKPSDTPSIVREKELHADVLFEVIGRTFPTLSSPFTVRFDRIEVFTHSNNDVGNYIRSWDGTALNEIDLPLLIDFPYSYTRWGRVPVDARMVAIKASIKLKLAMPRYATHIPPNPGANPPLQWLRRYGYFEIDVETAMQVTPLQSNVTIGGEPLEVITPPWLGNQGYNGLIPTATPDGNRIVYAREFDEVGGRPLPVRVPRKWRWVGRLGSFSDPVTEVFDKPPEAGWECVKVLPEMGIFSVPGLATANEDRPNDPNQNYDGNISFFFVVQP